MPTEIALSTPISDLFNSCPFGVLLIDRNGRICGANPALLEMLAVDERELLGNTPEDLPLELRGILASKDLIPIYSDTHEARWLRCQRRPIDGHISTVAEVRYFSEASDLVRIRNERDNLKRELEHATTLDPHTGLLNKRASLRLLDSQVSRSRRYDNLLSIILMEVQNDAEAATATHSVSEHVLGGVAGILKDQLRWVDEIGFLGDREFLLVLPETALGAAIRLTEKLAAEATRKSESLPEGEQFSTRFGTAQWRRGDDGGRLVQRARDCLLRDGKVVQQVANRA